MKNKLAIFDVDFTIKEHHGDGSKDGVFRSPLGFAKLFPNEKLPEELFTILKENGYHSFILAVVTALNKLGKTKNDIIDALASDGHLVKGMDKVFELLVKDYDIIIISGGYDEMVKRFLSRYGLLEQVSKIFAHPAMVSEDGKFEINSISKDWGGPCNVKIMHKGIGPEKLAICKMAILKHYLQLHQFEKIVFFGDGSNDLCLSLYLSSNDIVFPREGYKLASLLDQHCVQANVITWKDGFDIVKHI